jgi:hypothetical protein
MDRIRHDARGLLMLIFCLLRALCRMVIRHNARGLLGMKFKKVLYRALCELPALGGCTIQKLTEVTLEAS